MFWFAMAGFCILLAGICFAAARICENRNSDDEGWLILSCVLVVIVVCTSFIGMAYSLYERSAQIEDIENVKMYTAKAAIYERKANELTTQFAHYLADIYPQLERDVFKSIAPDKVSIYLAKYPELQSSKTVMALAEQIGALQADRYDQELKRQEVLRDLRYRAKNPWAVPAWIPAPPAEQ